jgi:two-component system sensor histidine kinase QseC
VNFSDRFLREFDDSVGTEFFQVFDAEGKSVERSDSLGRRDLPGLHGTLEEPVFWNLTLPNKEPGRAIGIAFEPRAARLENTQKVTVVVAAGRRQLAETVANLQVVFASCGAGLLALTAVVVPWVLRRGLRPLDAMAERATQINASSLGQRFDLEATPAELQAIGGRLNDLLARLEEAFERERRFGSDLAHELRTPLAELRSMAEVAIKWPQERAPGVDQAVLDIALQMEGLVARLLTLARAEQGRAILAAETVVLLPVVRALVATHSTRIAARRLGVEIDIPVTSAIETDPVLLRSILSNLIENAVAYSPPDGVVRIRFESDADGFSVEIENMAGDLQPEDLPRMFDRFWRKDSSRTGAGHSGLGLALSRTFAELLGLQLEPTLREGGTLIITLSSTRQATKG